MSLLAAHGLMLKRRGFKFPPALVLDPRDLSTLFQDAAGTVPVTADGDPVGRWNDKSGSGRDFIQVTSGARPVYRESGGVRWINFTVGQYLYGAAASSISFASVNLFVGYRAVSGTNDYGAVIGVPHANSHTSPFWRWSNIVRTSAPYEYGFTYNGVQGLNLSYDPAAVGNDVLATFGLSSLWSPNAGGSQRYAMVRFNRTQVVLGTNGSVTQTYPNATPAYIGAHLGTTEGRFQGRIYGILLANAPVTSQAWIDEWEDWIDERMP